MMRLLASCLALLTFLAGCDTIDSHTARQAQTELVGTSKENLYSCAGLPNRSLVIGATEYASYDYQPYTAGGLSATLPLVGGISFGATGNCHATAKVTNDHVTEIDYAGDTGSVLGHVANCASIFSHCLSGAKEATGRY